MDSPVIVDTASKFGRGIDLDSSFPGFPFDDDEGFGRRTDIRSHLDDLAARHPEFADHLIGPAWADIPFHGSLRNRRRGSGSGGGSYQSHPDEDARSQASGSSAASAASGASGVSSHGEPETIKVRNDRRAQNFEPEAKRSQIPQYGLRNTVDIGQHRHNMENPDKGNRGQRSMSAPPENRQTVGQQAPQEYQQTQQPQGQRFVSRVDITPQNNQPQAQPQEQKTQKPQKPQQQSNVRHIPIFVEGRDEPVIPRNVNEPHFRREPSPTQFQSSPHFRREPSPTQFQTPPPFQRQSPFGQHFGGRHHQWPPHFEETFYQPSSAFEQPNRRQQRSHNFQQPKQFAEKPQRPEAQHYEQQSKQQAKQQQQPKEQQKEPPKPKPNLPKDPLERVALVQNEVDSLAEQVRRYTGKSRQDKEYMYLDEMLTRELIKLDDIETEGRDNVRQARKNAIKAIQNTIGMLESMAPLPSQQTAMKELPREQQARTDVEATGQADSIDIERKEEQSIGPIPLPPCSSSPTSMENNEARSAEKLDENDQFSRNLDSNSENCRISSEPMDTTPEEKVESTAVGLQQEGKNSSQSGTENLENPVEEKKVEKASQEQAIARADDQRMPSEEKMEVDGAAARPSPNAPKKGKKTKKQMPVSEQPIPLPPPESAETSTK